MKKLLLLLGLLFTTNAVADYNVNCSNNQECYNSGEYVYEGGQDLVDLYNMSGTTNLNSNDDSYSSQVSLGMEWDRWGQTWSHARMSTNGCVNLRSGSAGGNSSNCSDYTPQSLPYRDYTLYPLWTDLIRGTSSGGQSSKMLFKDFGDYVVFGWYYLREYQRSSSNSFEAILYANNSYEYRYRELDIIQHDVVIGEQGKHSTNPEDTKTFLYYNDGQNGYSTFDAFLAGYGGPDIENGGSLYSGTFTEMCNIDVFYSTECSGYAVAYFNQQCGLNALYDSECSGYAAAYLSQQCGLNTLYSESCSGYAAAYLSQQCGISALYSTQCSGYAVAYFLEQCDIDALYASTCSGYNAALAQEEALYDAIYGTDDESYGYDDGYDEYGNSDEDMYGYSDDETNAQYGYDDSGDAYTDEDLWYDEEWDEYLDPSDPCYENACENFTDADWYALDVDQFGQENVDEWYGSDVEFTEDGYIDYGTSTEEEYWTNIDEGMDTFDAEQEAIWAAEEEAWAEEQRYYEEEEARMLAEAEEEYAQEEVAYAETYAEEEAFYASMETDADWYDYEVEEFGQEQVDEWWGEDVEFTEEGSVTDEYWEEVVYEDTESELYANATEDIYILEETVGVEIFVEEEWSTEEELDIYEEELEDYEREALEEQEEEVHEEFEEISTELEEEFLEIEDEAFEELINEKELEELFFEEESDEEVAEDSPSDEPEERTEKRERRVFRTVIAQQVGSVSSLPMQVQVQEQRQERVVQQAVSQQETSQAAQAVVAQIDFGGSAEVSQTVAEVVSSQIDDGSSSSFSSSGSGSSSGSSSGSGSSGASSANGSFSSGSVSYGNGASGGSLGSSSSQQEQVSQSTGSTLVVEQVEQSTGNTSIQVAQVVDSGPVVSAFEVAEQQMEDTSSEQMVELVFDDGSSFGTADQNFETSFDDALGAGQSIGQFLSNQTPSFAKFDVAPPTQSEQRTTDAVESLADRVGAAQTQANLQAQLEQVQDSGGFDSDQTATVAFLGYSAGFSQYTDQVQIADKDDWYRTRDMYKDNKLDDNQFSFYMMAGKTQVKLQEMIKSQYE